MASLCFAGSPPRATNDARAAQASHAHPAQTRAQQIIAALRHANSAASHAQDAAMSRTGEIFGGGSDGFACMGAIEADRERAIAQMEAPLTALTAATPTADECTVAAQLVAPLTTLAYGGMQNDPSATVSGNSFTAVTCRIVPVRLPADLDALLTAVRGRCPAALPPSPAELPCTLSVDHDFHLRPSETAASVGVEVSANTMVQVLGAGTLRRGATQMFHVRLIRNGPEGWTFLAPASLPHGCPPVASP